MYMIHTKGAPMLTIGICEDNESDRSLLQDMVSHIMFSVAETRIRLFSTSKALLQSIKAGQFDCNLLLLDIHMPQPNGMELAHELRKQQIDVDIIFVTKSQEHIFEGYTCKAFAYILKPVTMQRLSEELSRYLEELENTSECLNVTVQGETQRIPLTDIYYIESDKRKIILHTKKQTVEFYEKMETMEQILETKGFLRCHQSYMVQKRYVSSFGRSGIVLNGVSIPVSRKYYDSLKDLL